MPTTLETPDKDSESELYLDMDGVLVDYMNGWAKAKLMKPMPNIVEFWANLDWIKGGKELYRTATSLFQHVRILSSAGTEDPKKLEWITEGKKMWVEKNIPSMNLDQVFIVPGRRFKQQYSSRGSILVDDMLDTINQWNAKGGYGILHDANYYKETVSELQNMVTPSSLQEIVKRFRK